MGTAPRSHLRLVVEGPVEDEGRFRPALRRALNIIVALVGIVLTAPLMLAIAVAIKVTSPGPVFFFQDRVGLDRRWREQRGETDLRRRKDMGGRIFRIFKFRTMTHCEVGSREQKWATPDDPRVTPVGRFLRSTRMDELPQFFNVLKGDMNIVGPRPEQPQIFQELWSELDDYQKRQRVLPGITGLAQVKHHYDQSISDVEIKIRHDLEYVSRVSTLEDLRIMAKTIPVVLFRRGGW
jgi:lipopolysaccharide/colanic/teichoic acid biosynthesis glycosyltransferase